MKKEKMYVSPKVEVKEIKLTDIMLESNYQGDIFDGPGLGLGFDEM